MASENLSPRDPRFLAPVYWPTWIGLGLLRLSVWLPYPWLLRLGHGLGSLGYALLPARRRITRTNIRLAFPDLPEAEQTRIVRASFVSATLALFESALAWWAPDRKLEGRHQIEGLEHLEQALQAGHGALLLGGHYTTLEISGRLLAKYSDQIYPTYKRAHNPLFEAMMTTQRRRMNAGLIKSADMRAILRTLKDNRIVWYAPDQDFGLRNSVFAPFMGVPTATLTITARLAKRSGAPVLPFWSERLPNGRGYRLRIGPPLADFPCGDDVADARAVNAAIEQQVRRTPDQYLWGHRRFKTRPRGAPQLYKPRRDSALRRYSLVLGALAVPVVLYTLWQAWRARDKRYLTERLGLGPYHPGPHDLWLHAASVGEFHAILPLLERIRQRHPGLSILLTLNTPSAAMLARRKLEAAAVTIHYLPVDWQFAVARFIDRTRPRCGLIAETEIWPNLYLHCYHRGIPLVIVNGRLSEKTLKTPAWVRRCLGRALETTSLVLARSETDAERFRQLGAPPDHTRAIGNLKFAAPAGTPPAAFDAGRPYVLAASTRPGEERLIAGCWRTLQPDDALLVIVPRHPKRRGEILRELKPLGLKIAVRSRGEPIDAHTDVYLADTFGELEQFIQGARFVIMGGSLRPFGGQNILEAARAGKAVIFGPHMDNFEDEARRFLSADAALQVNQDAELCRPVATLLSDPARAAELGRHGQRLMQNMADMAERYLEELEAELPVLQDQSPDRPAEA